MAREKRLPDERRVVALELNALGKMGGLNLAGLQIAATPTAIHDPNGEVLFHRYALTSKEAGGWVDVAASRAFSEPILAVSLGLAWEPDKLVRSTRKAVSGRTWNESRFVAYSFPKIGVQFLHDGKEVALVECYTGAPVPPAREGRDDTPPGDFERWSVLAAVSGPKAKANERAFAKRLASWDEICPPGKWKRLGPKPFVINPEAFGSIFPLPFRARSRVLHYSTRNTDHATCYEVRGQLTNVWCVAASVQMVLDFYRYEYTQDRIAQALGLGTRTNPTGLPYSRDADVVTQLETLTSNALDAAMSTAPNWQQFVNEINANRPLISFVPGHSRTVAGYTETRLLNFFIHRGLLVYDPWPPTTGVITTWENFATTTYRVTFTAHVTLV